MNCKIKYERNIMKQLPWCSADHILAINAHHQSLMRRSLVTKVLAKTYTIFLSY